MECGNLFDQLHLSNGKWGRKRCILPYKRVRLFTVHSDARNLT